MNKKFNFKLLPLLKLRKFKENQVLTELASYNDKIITLENMLSSIDKSMDEFHDYVNKGDSSGSLDSSLVKYYSDFVTARSAKRAQLRTKVKNLEGERSEVLLRLNKAKSDIKVIENLMEKEKEKFKKMVEKKEQEEIEENFLLRKGREKC